MPSTSVHAADDDSYRTMIDAAREAIAVHRDGKLIYVNRAAIRMLGAGSAQDLLGQPVLERVHPDFKGWCARAWPACRRRPRPRP